MAAAKPSSGGLAASEPSAVSSSATSRPSCFFTVVYLQGHVQNLSEATAQGAPLSLCARVCQPRSSAATRARKGSLFLSAVSRGRMRRNTFGVTHRTSAGGTSQCGIGMRVFMKMVTSTLPSSAEGATTQAQPSTCMRVRRFCLGRTDHPRCTSCSSSGGDRAKPTHALPDSSVRTKPTAQQTESQPGKGPHGSMETWYTTLFGVNSWTSAIRSIRGSPGHFGSGIRSGSRTRATHSSIESGTACIFWVTRATCDDSQLMASSYLQPSFSAGARMAASSPRAPIESISFAASLSSVRWISRSSGERAPCDSRALMPAGCMPSNTHGPPSAASAAAEGAALPCSASCATASVLPRPEGRTSQSMVAPKNSCRRSERSSTLGARLLPQAPMYVLG
mmetsp:Transcript_25804/g.81337  ORF Transcript_25804/g.81337 Transcript_25804/m.81337 type:complete len:393 (+) Transcript_25804:485-1663(+)